MSARESDPTPPGDATRAQAPLDDSTAPDASIAAPAEPNRPVEAALSTVPTGDARQTLPSPETEDEETESEIELEMDADGEEQAPSPPLQPTGLGEAAASPPRPDAELGQGDGGDSEQEEEEDEAFPLVQRSPAGQLDEETKGGEEEEGVRSHVPSRGQEGEEEEEGGGDDDESKAEDASDEEEEFTVKLTGLKRPKTRIHVARDLELIRLMASEAPRMAAAERKRVVWEDAVERMNHRFKTWRALQARYSWLQIVLRDPSHLEHGRLTDEMKQLMKDFNVITGAIKPPRASPKRRPRVGFGDPAKRRKVAHKTEKLSLEEKRSATESVASMALPAEKPNATTPKFSEKASLDSAADETLMRAAVKVAPDFRAAQNKMDVWNKIAAASQHRYSTGFDARHHIRWLVKVFREPNHPQHSKLTPELRELVTTFLDVTGQPLAASGPTTPRNTATEIQLAERIAKANSANGTPKKVPRVTIRPKGDDMLVRLVLEKRPFAATTTAAGAIWTEIAVALAPTHPKITNGQTAHERFTKILKVFNDASHPNHNDFTKALREKLSSYNQIMASFRAKLSALKHKALQDDSSDASAEEVPIAKPRALGEGADLTAIATPPPPPPKEAPRTNMSTTTAETSKSTGEGNRQSEAGQANGTSRRKPPQPLNVQADELLMRVALEKQSWSLDGQKNTAAWSEVVAAVKDNSPLNQKDAPIWDAASARERVEWLVHVVQTPSHSDYGRLTSSLRKMLVKYNELSSSHRKRSTESPRLVKPAEFSSEEVGVSQDTKKRKEPSTAATKEPAKTEVPSPKRFRRASRGGARGNDNGTKREEKVGEPKTDDALLQEALRTRPFHSRRGDGMAAWDEVAVAIDERLGEPTYRTGGRALSRLKRLLGALRHPDKSKDIRLTVRQTKMLKLVDELLRVKWPSDETQMKNHHHSLQNRIERFLEEPLEETSPVDDSPRTKPLANPEPTRVRSASQSDDDDDDDDDDEQQPEVRIVPRSTKELEKLRRQLDEANRQRDALRMELASRTATNTATASTHPSRHHDQVNALQDEVIRLRAAAASDRAAFETQLQLLEDELASYRAQLGVQTTRLDGERREHRDELRNMVEMLQSERAAHERDTAAMLAVVNREREDRRDEFVAMMNLVTRSVLQPTESSS
jgi:hypothetical protein